MTDAARPRVVVCGLGPAGTELVTAATRDALVRVPQRFLRTTRHPAAEVAEVAGETHSFDGLYETAADLDEVYTGIVEALVEAAGAHGEVLYAVPGSPTVAERTVELLRADPRVVTEVLPALSFVDLAWARLGVDPLARSVRLVDGHRFDTEAAGERGPLLVAQCDSQDVLSDIKLALGETFDAVTAALTPDVSDPAADSSRRRGTPPATADPPTGDRPTVTVLQRLGLPDEVVREVPWDELDREVRPDHLTSLWIPRLGAPVAGEVAGFAAIVRRLRAECPWDREQTHHSLRRHLLEEAYEVLEAIDHVDPDGGVGFDELEEELGDLLAQIVFHATLAAEQGQFTLADVARGISDKLVGRHPHVFGDADVATADEVAVRWEQIKQAEKGRASVMDGIPSTLPALLYALKVQDKAASEGVDWRGLLDAAVTGPPDGASVGDGGGNIGRALLDLVDAARAEGTDPESELRIAAEQLRDRFQRHEKRSLG